MVISFCIILYRYNYVLGCNGPRLFILDEVTRVGIDNGIENGMRVRNVHHLFITQYNQIFGLNIF